MTNKKSMAVALICVVGSSAASRAQDFPRQPVRLVAATPPGGAADVNARRLADQLSRRWGQPVVIQNSTGGAGNVAASTVAQATPNGHTLLFAAHPVFAVNPLLYRKLPFDPDRDFAPVVLFSRMPHVLLVSASFSAASIGDLVKLAKAKPGSLSFGSGGAGTSIHLAGELFRETAQIDIRHVPYRGGAPSIAGLLSGEIQMLFDATVTAIGHVRGGRMRALAIASANRSPALSDVPTFNESGVHVESSIAHGVMAPVRTPAAIVTTLNNAINDVLIDGEYRRQMGSLGVELVGGPPQQLQTFLTAERRKWAPLVKKLALTAE